MLFWVTHSFVIVKRDDVNLCGLSSEARYTGPVIPIDSAYM